MRRPLRRFAGASMWRELRAYGGARNWLLFLRRTRRRIGVTALESVWSTAVVLDWALGNLSDQAADRFLKRDHSLEGSFRFLACWHHLHATGNRREALHLLWDAPPGVRSIAPLWMIRGAKRIRQRRRGLEIAESYVHDRADFCGHRGKADNSFTPATGTQTFPVPFSEGRGNTCGAR